MQGHRLPERLHRPVGVPVPLHVGAEHLEGVGQLAQDGVALFPQELDGFPCRARGRLRSIGAGQAPGEGSQRCGEARTEDLGALRCQLAVEGDGFPCHPETCPGVARLVEVTGEAVQGPGQLRTELGPPGGEYAEAAARLLARVDRPGDVAHGRAVVAERVESRGEPGEEGVRIPVRPPPPAPTRRPTRPPRASTPRQRNPPHPAASRRRCPPYPSPRSRPAHGPRGSCPPHRPRRSHPSDPREHSLRCVAA